MSGILFSEIMDFYPKHNASVYEDLKKDYQNGSLIPFVGAGLSAFCGYSGWSQVLKELAGYIYESDIRDRTIQMIDGGGLLQAAQTIYDNYPRMLRELRKIIDYNKLANCEPGAWYTSAAYVLPYLFGAGMVMTTNFDRVLEEVYDKCHVKFGKVVSPYEPDILAQIRQTSPHCLFKLHGDIGPETHDIDRLAFTQKQYDMVYENNGLLLQELPLWFQNKRLLFLGCSLMQDKTMEVLQRVTEKNPGLDHYAILACKPDEIGQRSRELGKMGISPIYYPEGRYEAVRVILERLLEETAYSKYEEMKQHVERHVPVSKTKHRFMYDSGYIGFTGRTSEFTQLMDFCQNPKQILWWAVTGPGGMGKSRLVYEFTEACKKEGWEIVWLNQNIYPKMLNWTPPAQRCILVADDVQSYIQAIGEWIGSVSTRKRSEKLRILLLEREGEKLGSAKWEEMMQADAPYDDTIPSLCYCSDFLRLTPLSEDELKAIMTDFASASGKTWKDDGLMERLLKTLQEVDGDLQRPLYALAIVDAWCAGENPTHWDKEQILNELTNRELRFYYNRLKNLSSDRISKELRAEFENLLARSCVRGILPLDEVRPEEYRKLQDRADKLEMEFHELLRAMGVVHRVKDYIGLKSQGGTELYGREEEFSEAVALDCPDLIKEYLVLRQAFEKGRMKLLLPDGWVNQPYQLHFLYNVLSDYPEKLRGRHQFWKIIFDGKPRSDGCAWQYSGLLLGVIVHLPELQECAVERLEEVSHQFQQDEVTELAYAMGLIKLIIERPLKEREESVVKLSALYERNDTNEKIAELYANGLFFLAAEQPLKEREESVSKLADLYEQHDINEEVAEKYAQGLFGLIAEQPLHECEQSACKLETLYERHDANEKIAELYAMILYHRVFEKSLKDCEKSVSKLAELYERYGTNKEIVAAYAKGLRNLTMKQPLKEREESVSKLMTLYERNNANEEIAAVYARGLANLSGLQPSKEREESVLKLVDLYNGSDRNEEMAISFALGLANSAAAQDSEEKVREILLQSKALLNERPQNITLQFAYAATWLGLTFVQSLESLHQTVLELQAFLRKHPKANERFQFELANYLAKHPEQREQYAPLILKS